MQSLQHCGTYVCANVADQQPPARSILRAMQLENAFKANAPSSYLVLLRVAGRSSCYAS